MDTTPNLPPAGPSSSHPLAALGARWGWFVALGVVMLVLGFTAAIHVAAATLASVYFIGFLVVLAGAAQLVQAWRVRQWRGFLIWTASGVLYVAAGLLVLIDPIAGAAVITLLLGAVLIGAGALRLWIWFQHRAQPGWPWLALSGAISLAVGLLVAAGWPGNSVWLLGLVLAFDLVLQGASLVMLGVGLRRGHRLGML